MKVLKKLVFPFKILISFLVLFLLFKNIGLSEVYGQVRSVNGAYILGIVLLLIIVWIIGTLNIFILIRSADIKIKFSKLFKFFLISWSIGSFLPGRVGEFYLLRLMKKEGVGYGPSMAVSVMDKLLTFICLSILTVIAFVVLLPTENMINLILVILGCFLLFLISMSGKVRGILRKYVLRKYAGKFKGFSKTFFFYVKKRKKMLLLNLLLTFVKWLFSAVAFFIIFLAFGVKISLFTVLIITSATTLLSFVPITMSGLGVRESIGIFLYSLIGVEKTLVFSNYILMDIRNYFPAFLIFVVYLFLNKNKKS